MGWRVDPNLHAHPYFSKVTAFPLKLRKNVRQALTDHRRDRPGARGECQRCMGGIGYVHSIGQCARKEPANGGRQFRFDLRPRVPRRDGGVGGQDPGQGLQGLRFGHGQASWLDK